MSRRYENWTLGMIREELKSRGAKISGRKAECVDRLVAYDRNANFKCSDDDDATPVYNIDVPPIGNFKDLNTGAQVPRLDVAAANQYLLPFKKNIGNVNRLWQSRFMRFVRWAKADSHVYFRGNCRAEMRKSVTYDLDIVVDMKGNIRQTQCECAAGMGPNAHCKHVKCLLYGLLEFFSYGHLNTELTCTQQLQTFHKANKLKGSPLKMGQITVASRSTTVPSSTSHQRPLRYDPRKQSEHYQANYNSHVRNCAINFSSSAPNMPIMQMIPPANPFAICLDHDYCDEIKPDQILRHLKVTHVSQEECNGLEKATRGQADNQTWQDERLHRLHSSHFGRICKATDRTDKDSLAKSYTVFTKINTAPIKHGRTYASVAMERYKEKSNLKIEPCGIFVNPDCPYIASSPDGIIDADILVEIKCPYVARDKNIQPSTIPYLTELDGVLNLNKNHDYYYQVQGQMYCANRKTCNFVVFTKVDMKIIVIEKDEAFITDMLAKLKTFFDEHFKPALLNKYVYRDYYDYRFVYERDST